MSSTREKFKPAVDKRVLLLLAGSLWIGVGILLLNYSYSWLHTSRSGHSLVFLGIGVGVALLIHHFGFLRIVDRNLRRILPMEGKKCVFSFMTWKSYVIAAVMVMMGILLRHSPIPKPYLSIVYTGIGLALILSSERYLRILMTHWRTINTNPK